MKKSYIFGIILLYTVLSATSLNVQAKETRSSPGPTNVVSITQSADLVTPNDTIAITIDLEDEAEVDNVTLKYFTESVNSTIDKDLPPFIPFTDTHGANRSTFESRGKITVLEFFYVSCPYCLHFVTDFKPLYSNLSQWVDVYSLGTRNAELPETDLASYAANEGLPWIVGRDYTHAHDLPPFEIEGVPTIVIVAPNSTITDIIIGYADSFMKNITSAINSLIPFVQPLSNTVNVPRYGPFFQIELGPFSHDTRVNYYITAMGKETSPETTVDTNNGSYYHFDVWDSSIVPTTTGTSTNTNTSTTPGFDSITTMSTMLIVFLCYLTKKRKFY